MAEFKLNALAACSHDLTNLSTLSLLEHDLEPLLDAWSRIPSRRLLCKDFSFVRRRDTVNRVLSGFEWDTERCRGRSVESPNRLRAMAWNIERGKRFEALVGLLSESPDLSGADLLLLTEVDKGMGRSGNRNVARELAVALDMGYVFVNHHLVLSPGDSGERLHELPNTLAMHGSALLSRWPIGAISAVSLPEYSDKFHAFEKRLGCKRALLCEIHLPDGPLLVAVVHLDPFAPPWHRAWQMQLVLNEINLRGATRVLMGGDLNTTTYDLANGVTLMANIGYKLLRFGVQGTIEQYLNPHHNFEREIFDQLLRSGLNYADFNAIDEGTYFYDTHEEEWQEKALHYLPERVLRRLEKLAEPWDGVIPMRLDWFAGRGLSPAKAWGLHRPTWRDQMISDHSPVVVDLDMTRGQSSTAFHRATPQLKTRRGTIRKVRQRLFAARVRRRRP